MSKPPKLAKFLLKILSSREKDEAYLGDIEELFHDRAKCQGPWHSKRWYWWEIVKSIPRFVKESIRWRMTMLGNYFKVTFRNMKVHKGYSFINIGGLAVGIACCLLIFSWARYELSFDRFHKNARDIYRLVSEFHSPGGEINYTETNQAPLAAVLKDKYPEIVNSTRALRWEWKVGRENMQFEESIWLVDPAFVDMFTISFIQGDPATALSNPESIVLTESLAKKHFLNENPMGKTVIAGQRTPLIVSGVIKDIPQNSHLYLDALMPIIFSKKAGLNLDEWSGFNFMTYVQLQKGISGKDVEQKIKYVLKDYFPETTTSIQLQPLTEVHLYALGGG
ncbi:MAG: ABC transporter permease [Candidatus Aminicenantes bacterium]|nr:ABC transporter permease [Candidatus Aminicenantes bacterium]